MRKKFVQHFEKKIYFDGGTRSVYTSAVNSFAMVLSEMQL